MTPALDAALNRIAQTLAEASLTPHGFPALGLTPTQCREVALFVDRHIVVAAPIAEPACVTDLREWRRRHGRLA